MIFLQSFQANNVETPSQEEIIFYNDLEDEEPNSSTNVNITPISVNSTVSKITTKANTLNTVNASTTFNTLSTVTAPISKVVDSTGSTSNSITLPASTNTCKRKLMVDDVAPASQKNSSAKKIRYVAAKKRDDAICINETMAKIATSDVETRKSYLNKKIELYEKQVNATIAYQEKMLKLQEQMVQIQQIQVEHLDKLSDNFQMLLQKLK